MKLDGPVIDLRGPCHHLVARLAVRAGVVEYKCLSCSKRAGRPVFHYFDVATGLEIPAPAHEPHAAQEAHR